MKLGRLFRRVRKSFSSYHPSIEISIYKENILHNLKTFRTFTRLQIAPVIKSNAYGHGLIKVAQILDGENIPFFVVDSLFEARALRSEGVSSRILVIGYTPTENILSSLPPLTSISVGSLSQLNELALRRAKTIIHLKVDTGMHRQGIMVDELSAAIEIIKRYRLTLEGICSHLSDAENEDVTRTEAQISIWNSVVEKCKIAFPELTYIHLSASAGAQFTAKIQANVLRLGLGLYGIDLTPSSTRELKPALSLRAPISSVRTIDTGESIGYGATFTAKRKMRIATAPLGYYEGVDRRLSNKGAFRVRGKYAPIVGRVSMNITSIDVTEVPDIAVGDMIEIISDNPQALHSIESFAKICDTIPYELLVHLPAHLSRNVL